jgi:hypothetical protein
LFFMSKSSSVLYFAITHFTNVNLILKKKKIGRI